MSALRPWISYPSFTPSMSATHGQSQTLNPAHGLGRLRHVASDCVHLDIINTHVRESKKKWGTRHSPMIMSVGMKHATPPFQSVGVCSTFSMCLFGRYLFLRLSSRKSKGNHSCWEAQPFACQRPGEPPHGNNLKKMDPRCR